MLYFDCICTWLFIYLDSIDAHRWWCTEPRLNLNALISISQFIFTFLVSILCLHHIQIMKFTFQNDQPNMNEDPNLTCSYCCGTAQCNKAGDAEELLSCFDCGNSGQCLIALHCVFDYYTNCSSVSDRYHSASTLSIIFQVIHLASGYLVMFMQKQRICSGSAWTARLVTCASRKRTL